MSYRYDLQEQHFGDQWGIVGNTYFTDEDTAWQEYFKIAKAWPDKNYRVVRHEVLEPPIPPQPVWEKGHLYRYLDVLPRIAIVYTCREVDARGLAMLTWHSQRGGSLPAGLRLELKSVAQRNLYVDVTDEKFLRDHTYRHIISGDKYTIIDAMWTDNTVRARSEYPNLNDGAKATISMADRNRYIDVTED